MRGLGAKHKQEATKARRGRLGFEIGQASTRTYLDCAPFFFVAVRPYASTLLASCLGVCENNQVPRKVTVGSEAPISSPSNVNTEMGNPKASAIYPQKSKSTQGPDGIKFPQRIFLLGMRNQESVQTKGPIT